ncbi:MAG: glycosyltransferase 87 family protein, partial [Candidatus Dormibacteria bacterium]
LAAGVVAFMVGRRDWRGLAGAAAGAAVVAAGGLVTAGPAATSGFVHALLQPENSPPAQMQGVSGLIGSLFGGGLGPYAVSLLLGGVAALVAGWLGAITRRRSDLLEPTLLGAAALSLWASPHLLGHDLVILAPPLVATLAWAMTREVRQVRGWPGSLTLSLVAGWAALSIASDLDLGQNAVGLPGRLTPWVLLAGAVAIAVRVSAGSPGPASAAERRGWSALRE